MFSIEVIKAMNCKKKNKAKFTKKVKKLKPKKGFKSATILQG
jgi:hypothetical protein